MTHPKSSRATSMHGAVDLSGLRDRPPPAGGGGTAPPAGGGGTAPPAGGGGAAPSAGPPKAASASSDVVFDVSEADFESQVVERSLSQVVVLDLWATWCEPCKQLSPVLEGLAAKAGGRWALAKVDVDANPAIAQLFGARSIPMVVALAGGRPVSAFQGVQPEPVVRQWLADVLEQAAPLLGEEVEQEAQKSDPRLVTASEALADGDFAKARSLFEDVRDRSLDEAEGSQKAATRKATAETGLREVAFLERVSTLSPDVVRTAQEDPKDVGAQLDVADLEVAAGQTEQAFDRLIDVVRSSVDPERTNARKRILELFELFDPADPVVTAARRKLASALY